MYDCPHICVFPPPPSSCLSCLPHTMARQQGERRPQGWRIWHFSLKWKWALKSGCVKCILLIHMNRDNVWDHPSFTFVSSKMTLLIFYFCLCSQIFVRFFSKCFAKGFGAYIPDIHQSNWNISTYSHTSNWCKSKSYNHGLHMAAGCIITGLHMAASSQNRHCQAAYIARVKY